MALVACKECGNKVSTEAKLCPQCGAKVQRSVGIFGIAVALLLGWMIFEVVRGSSYAGSMSTAPPEHTAAIPTPEAAWEYSTFADSMTGKPVQTARMDSSDLHDLHWPYGPNISAHLQLRQHPRFGKDVLVDLDKGQILCHSYEPCNILVRFDDRPPITFSGMGTSDNSTDSVFIQNYAKFLTALKQSKTIRVELPMYQDGNISWTFKVANLNWK